MRKSHHAPTLQMRTQVAEKLGNSPQVIHIVNGGHSYLWSLTADPPVLWSEQEWGTGSLTYGRHWEAVESVCECRCVCTGVGEDSYVSSAQAPKATSQEALRPLPGPGSPFSSYTPLSPIICHRFFRNRLTNCIEFSLLFLARDIFKGIQRSGF